MSAKHRPVRVVCVGATIVDTLGRPVTLIPDGQGRQILDEIRITAAGTAAGTAVDLAKLGADVTLMGAVGDDLLADFLAATLRSHGVDASRLARKAGTQTSATILPIRPNGDRPALHTPGATALLDAADVDISAIRGADLLHLGGPDVLGSFGTGPAAEILADAQRHGVVTTVDLLSRGGAHAWEALRALLSHVDYFLPNDQQLRALIGINDLGDAARTVLRHGVKAVLVSCGPDGALLVTADGDLQVPALADAVVDTTGCGDACSAGFIAGLLRGWQLVDAAWLGMAAAGLVASGLGSDAGIVDFAATAARVVARAPSGVANRVRADLDTAPAASAGSGPTALLPCYADLPGAANGGRSAWGVFGDKDSLGTINLQTPERIAGAAALIRTGEVFPLNAPITFPDPPLFLRKAVRHTLLPEPDTPGFDERLDVFYPQGSSQWDSLAHVGYAADAFYNGTTAAEIRAGSRNTIDRWARRGIAGRAVLLDVDALLGGAGTGYDPGASRAISVSELEAARRAASVVWQPGDIMLVHTGFLRWYEQQPADVRERMAESEDFEAVGLARTEEMVGYLWDAHVSAVASDNPAVEVWPPRWDGGPFGFLHRMLIGQLGLALGELWWLDDLAQSCRGDARYTAFLTAAPLHLPGGVGSPANAIALK